jgi:hypothetical protein
VGADRAGNVRESWPEGCDSTGIQTALRDIVKTWKLRPPVSNGVPVQVEALLGFTFHTVVHDNPLPLLTDAEIRQLATNTVEPALGEIELMGCSKGSWKRLYNSSRDIRACQV